MQRELHAGFSDPAFQRRHSVPCKLWSGLLKKGLCKLYRVEGLGSKLLKGVYIGDAIG